MIKEIEYSEVFDAQEHFRTLMDAFSQPGSLQLFNEVAINLPEGLHVSAAYVALALMNTDVTCAVHLENEKQIKAYLSINTNVGFAAVDDANFLLTDGQADSQLIDSVYEGDPGYPETSGFVILQVEKLSNEPLTSAIGVELSGPGIQTTQALYIAGISNEVLASIQFKNSEYPLGVEIILCAADGTVSVIPRSSKITNLKND
jgi:alpha-D-ribose 1-methylphosphonate 5-triphosphate synthase subunit PhnH